MGTQIKSGMLFGPQTGRLEVVGLKIKERGGVSCSATASGGERGWCDCGVGSLAACGRVTVWSHMGKRRLRTSELKGSPNTARAYSACGANIDQLGHH